MKRKLTGKEKRQLRIKPTTIEKIECDNWGNDAPYPSHLVTTIYALRKKDLNTFTIEDLRIVIGQNLSLPILVPMAIEVLRDKVLASGDFYPGDLLQSVLNVKTTFWEQHPELKKAVIELFEANRSEILSSEDIGDNIVQDILEAYETMLQNT